MYKRQTHFISTYNGPILFYPMRITAPITDRLEQQINGKEFFSQHNLHCSVTYKSSSYFLIKISSSSQILSCMTSSACPNIVASKVSSPSKLASVDRILAIRESHKIHFSLQLQYMEKQCIISRFQTNHYLNSILPHSRQNLSLSIPNKFSIKDRFYLPGKWLYKSIRA